MTRIGTQMALDIYLQDFSSIENYLPGKNNEVVTCIQAVARGEIPPALVYLWGPAACGKTHLLQAACRLARIETQPSAYIPLADRADLSVEILEGLLDCALVCIDDVDLIAGDGPWERAVLGLYEQLHGKVNLIFAAHCNARSGHWQLADLQTRLAAGIVYQMHALDDAGKLAAIQQRATQRGFELSDDVAHYMLNRYPRDFESLLNLLDQLDRASLRQQRRITIPFIRSLEARSST